jgi:hypothetical protein
MNRATRKEYLTGRNGSYETDPVKGVTPSQQVGNQEMQGMPMMQGMQMHEHSNFGRTDESFRGGMTGEQLVGVPNFQNPMNTLHNNLGQSVLFEQNMDNKVFIDAEFRDTSFTDSRNQPFKFTVRFKDSEQMPNSRTVTLEYNGEVYSYKTYKKKAAEIVFPFVYHNVNFVIIDNLIMPSHIEYATQSDGSIKKIPGRRLARTQRYIVLKVEQLNNCKKLSNNPKIDNRCFIMKNDDTSGVNNEFYIPIHDQLTTFQSQLPTIDRLDIDICDNKGDPLYPTLDGEIVNFHEVYIESIDELEKELAKPPDEQNQNKIDRLELRLISLRQIVSCIDPELHITINNVNQQINTRVNYRR